MLRRLHISKPQFAKKAIIWLEHGDEESIAPNILETEGESSGEENVDNPLIAKKSIRKITPARSFEKKKNPLQPLNIKNVKKVRKNSSDSVCSSKKSGKQASVDQVPPLLQRALCTKSRSPKNSENFLYLENAVGREHQAHVGPFKKLRGRDEEEDRDERMWCPPDDDQNLDYDLLKNAYWRAIWRQFENHIPMEVALQWLMINDYSIEKSLDSIDQVLPDLPRAFQPLRVVQIERFKDALKKMKKGPILREIQKNCMPNYNLDEIHHFCHAFQHHIMEKTSKSCHCNEPLCEDLEFQPRWACQNCNKALKYYDPIPDDTKLCLICSTYQGITGNTRPSKATVFSKEEANKVISWNTLMRTSSGSLSREEFEKIYALKRSELTKEEIEILGHNDNINRHLAVEKRISAMSTSEKLKPYSIPLFQKCGYQNGHHMIVEVCPGVAEKLKTMIVSVKNSKNFERVQRP